MKDKISCIVADCDGTILDSSGEIDTELIPAIHALAAQNIPFTLASGRSRHLMHTIMQRLPIEIPYIADNGSSIYQRNHILSQTYIPDHYIGFIKDILIENNVPFIIYGKSVIANYHGKPPLSFFRNVVHSSEQLISLDTHPNVNHWHHIYKIVIDTDRIIDFESIASTIREKCKDMNLDRSEGNLYTCSSKGATKGRGLIKIAEVLHITCDQIMVFGDNYNDISMFKKAGYAIAMDNSSHYVKSYADAVCPDNEHHGVSDFLIQFLRNKNCHE